MSEDFDISADAEALAHRVAEWLIGVVAAHPAPVRVALSGGSTPRRMFTRLAAPECARRMDWAKLHVFWGDERCVPYDSTDSNYGEAKRLLLDHVPIIPAQIHPFDVTLPPVEAARAYDELLRRSAPDGPIFAVTFLGLGEDGHTASLLPGQPVLEEREALAAMVAEGRPEVRLTLTYPALARSEIVAFLVSGEAKRPIFRDLRAGLADVPAARLRPEGRRIWFADQSALG